jgi:hypothetical protein
VSILPKDPLARWVVYFCLVVSIAAPLIAALVLLIVH